MNINMIGVPLFYGCDRKGVELGPNSLRAKNVVTLMKECGHKVYDLGNLFVPDVDEADKYSFHDKMKYLNPVVDVNTNLAHQVYTSLVSQNFPFIVGGDHSLGLGTISGASKYFDDLAVIWVDAHGDINTFETSPSGNIHGMPLAAAMGLGHPTLTNLYFDGQKVNPENIFLIGARDLDEGETVLVEDKHLNVWSTDDIKKKSVETVIAEVIKKLKDKNIKNIHLSFDIDVLDPSIVMGTGTRVNNGLNIEEGKYLLRSLLETKLIKSMDFVELNPHLDPSTKSIDVALELIKEIFTTL